MPHSILIVESQKGPRPGRPETIMPYASPFIIPQPDYSNLQSVWAVQVENAIPASDSKSANSTEAKAPVVNQQNANTGITAPEVK